MEQAEFFQTSSRLEQLQNFSKSAEFLAEFVTGSIKQNLSNFARAVTKIKERCEKKAALTEVERVFPLLKTASS